MTCRIEIHAQGRLQLVSPLIIRLDLLSQLTLLSTLIAPRGRNLLQLLILPALLLDLGLKLLYLLQH